MMLSGGNICRILLMDVILLFFVVFSSIFPLHGFLLSNRVFSGGSYEGKSHEKFSSSDCVRSLYLNNFDSLRRSFIDFPGVNKIRSSRMPLTRVHLLDQVVISGGPAVVTGLESLKEWKNYQHPLQEFHDLKKYDPIVALVGDSAQARKIVVSRLARYSGLLGVLRFNKVAEPNDISVIKEHLKNAKAWLAFISSPKDISSYISQAVESEIERLVLVLTDIFLATNDLKMLSLLKNAIEKAKPNTVVTVIMTGKTELSSDEKLLCFQKYSYEKELQFVKAASEKMPVVPLASIFRAAADVFELPEAAESILYLYHCEDSYENKGRRELATTGQQKLPPLWSRLVDQGGATKKERKRANFPRNETESAAYTINKVKEDAGNILVNPKKLAAAPEQDVASSIEQEISELFDKAKKDRSMKRQKLVSSKAHQVLSDQWKEKFYTAIMEDTLRDIPSEAEFIEENWERGVSEASKLVDNEDML